jgi:chloramphenicol 3-O-phosphotransferase
MTPGKLIVITGPAAVGKSTVSRAIQAVFATKGEICMVLELDTFGRGVPREWVSIGTHRGANSELGFDYVRTEAGSMGLALGDDGRRVLIAFHRSVAAVASSGMNAVCETIVYDEDDWRDWSEALHNIPVCWVRLCAPVEVLDEREKADRSRVFQGLARGMSARKRVGTYDIEADTSTETANSIVQRIIAKLGS